MTKILITPKNSIWGVIINPQSSNTYRHALNFATPQIKEAFINKELFNAGDDYKALLAATPERAFTRLTATSAEFVVEVSEYPNETFVSLLNKDFCIIEENGVEQFYTLSGKRNGSGNTIIYTAELDIFFTYNIKDMFNDKETDIQRAMYDRFILDNSMKIVPRENYSNTPLLNTETFDNGVSELTLPEYSPEELLPELTIEFDSSISAELQKELTPQISKAPWSIVAIKTKHSEDNPLLIAPWNASSKNTSLYSKSTSIDFGTSTAGNILPFIYFCAPAQTEHTFKSSNDDIIGITFNSIINTNTAWMRAFSQEFLENAAVMKNTLSILPSTPLAIANDFKFSVRSSNNNKYVVEILPTSTSPLTEISFPRTIFSTDGTAPIPYAVLSINRLIHNYKEYSLTQKINKSEYILNQNSPRNIDNEIKLNFSPYSIFKIGSDTKSKGILKPENFTKNEIKYKINNAFMTSQWGYIVDLKNYSNINNPSVEFLPSNQDFSFEDFSNFSLPTDTNAWEEFIVRNKSQQNASFLSKGIGTGIGVLGAIAAPFTGGASAAAAGIGLASLAAKSASDLNQQFAQRRDIKNTPNTINNTGSLLSFNIVNKEFLPFLQKYSVEPFLKQAIFDHIYKYGYNFNGINVKINDFLDTRYWFNYIEASQTFENIKLQASADIKQLINDTVENGLTIWHVRNLDEFKGIKTYENENVEISLITAPALADEIDFDAIKWNGIIKKRGQ